MEYPAVSCLVRGKEAATASDAVANRRGFPNTGRAAGCCREVLAAWHYVQLRRDRRAEIRKRAAHLAIKRGATGFPATDQSASGCFSYARALHFNVRDKKLKAELPKERRVPHDAGRTQPIWLRCSLRAPAFYAARSMRRARQGAPAALNALCVKLQAQSAGRDRGNTLCDTASTKKTFLCAQVNKPWWLRTDPANREMASQHPDRRRPVHQRQYACGQHRAASRSTEEWSKSRPPMLRGKRRRPR